MFIVWELCCINIGVDNDYIAISMRLFIDTKYHKIYYRSYFCYLSEIDVILLTVIEFLII